MELILLAFGASSFVFYLFDHAKKMDKIRKLNKEVGRAHAEICSKNQLIFEQKHQIIHLQSQVKCLSATSNLLVHSKSNGAVKLPTESN